MPFGPLAALNLFSAANSASGGGGGGLFGNLFGGFGGGQDGGGGEGGGLFGSLRTGAQRFGEGAGGIASLFGAQSQRKNLKAQTRLLNQSRRLRKKVNPFFFDPSQAGNPFESLDQGFQDILGELAGFGSGRRASIEQGSKESRRSAQALLQNRGLGSSVLAENTLRGSERQRQLLLGELDDQVTGLRVNARQQDQNRQLQQQQLLASLLG